MSKLDLQLAISKVMPHLQGWPNKGERPYRMAELIVEVQPEIVVEIGVFYGASLIPQALALAHVGKGKIYGIDPYDMTAVLEGLAPEEQRDWWQTQDLNKACETVRSWVKKLELEEQVGMIRQESRISTYWFKDEEIDILHIDGAHSEASALEDVTLYQPKMKKGGYIWFDDSDFPATQKALRELEKFCTLKHDYITYRLYEVR